ncbi:MAG: LytTR family transcriptional regulator, partial [Pedobacter sp.]
LVKDGKFATHILEGEAAEDLRASSGVWVQCGGGHLWVPSTDIRWVCAARDYALLHCTTGVHTHRATMGDLTQALADAGLVRIHRSYIVSTRAIVRVDRLQRQLTEKIGTTTIPSLPLRPPP